MGPLCSIESTTAADNLLSDCDATLTQYEAALQPPDPACGADATGNVVVWTPDKETPDVVYYQVSVNAASHLAVSGGKSLQIDMWGTGNMSSTSRVITTFGMAVSCVETVFLGQRRERERGGGGGGGGREGCVCVCVCVCSLACGTDLRRVLARVLCAAVHVCSYRVSCFSICCEMVYLMNAFRHSSTHLL